MRGSWVDTDRASVARWPDGRGHVLGVERAGHAQRAPAGPWRAGSSARACELLHGAGSDDLARAVVVGRGRGPGPRCAASTSSRSPPRTAVMPVAVVAAASAIALPRSRTSTIACSAVIARAPAAAASSPTLWPGDGTDLAERVGRVREQLERRDQPGGHQQRLGDLRVADRLGVRLGAVVGEVDAGDGRQPLEPARRTSGPRARGRGSRGSGLPDRERR